MRQSWSWVLPRMVFLLVSIAMGAGVLAGCATTSNTAPSADTANAQPAQAATGTTGTTGTTGMAGMAGMAVPAPGPGAASPDAPVATDTVAIQNFAYSPATVTVKVGSTVTWTNQDQDQHTVTAMNNGPFHSAPLNTGESYRYTFTAPGHFDYLCTIHPFMTATVVVTP
jgi:plastocyanin